MYFLPCDYGSQFYMIMIFICILYKLSDMHSACHMNLLPFMNLINWRLNENLFSGKLFLVLIMHYKLDTIKVDFDLGIFTL